MIRNLSKVLTVSIGVIFVILGLAGLVLPLVNGTVLLIVGFIIISFENLYIEKKLLHFTKKNKTIYTIHSKLDLFLRKIFKR